MPIYISQLRHVSCFFSRLITSEIGIRRSTRLLQPPLAPHGCNMGDILIEFYTGTRANWLFFFEGHGLKRSGLYSTAGTCEREMERRAESECVWFRPLAVRGDLLSHGDKGNCGVSVYGPVLIASPLKDPTYGTLIDSWQHTQGGFWIVFVGNPQ